MCSADKQLKSIASAHTDEQVEAQFEEMKANVERLLPSLSRVQQEIIREKFFKIDQMN